MKKLVLFLLAGVALSSLVGCNTVKGVGEDISTVGEGVSKASDSVQEGVTGTAPEAPAQPAQ